MVNCLLFLDVSDDDETLRLVHETHFPSCPRIGEKVSLECGWEGSGYKNKVFIVKGVEYEGEKYWVNITLCEIILNDGRTALEVYDGATGPTLRHCGFELHDK